MADGAVTEPWLAHSALDGAVLEVVSSGAGEGVVVVGGGGTDVSIYRRLAQRLGQSFAVHVYNRRGRGASAARDDGYGLATEVGDLAGVMAATGATRVVGHSVGGFFALSAARELAIERLALYEPVINVDGGFPVDYLPEFERLIDAGDTVGAMVVMARGLRNPGSGMPDALARAATRAVLLTPPGHTLGALLPTVPPEARMAAAQAGPASDWAGVTAVTRFFVGERSPDYYVPMAQALVAAMPHATLEMIPRAGHDVLARASRSTVGSLAAFLAG